MLNIEFGLTQFEHSILNIAARRSTSPQDSSRLCAFATLRSNFYAESLWAEAVQPDGDFIPVKYYRYSTFRIQLTTASFGSELLDAAEPIPLC